MKNTLHTSRIFPLKSKFLKLMILKLPSSHATNVFAELIRSDFTRIRDYILPNLILNKLSRPVAILNMNLREFNSAKKQGESFVVPGINHKAGYIAPGMISFNNA